MSDADQTELKALAELLKEGLLPREDAPAYANDALKRALADVARTLTDAPFKRPRTA